MPKSQFHRPLRLAMILVLWALHIKSFVSPLRGFFRVIQFTHGLRRGLRM
jgi:hypothetical protein